VYTYPSEFLESLVAFGLAPRPETPPALVREALGDLYRYELRLLRNRLLVGEFPRDQYQEHIIALRKRYWLLTLQLPAWERICAGLPPA
jgi:hypothetical protein